MTVRVTPSRLVWRPGGALDRSRVVTGASNVPSRKKCKVRYPGLEASRAVSGRCCSVQTGLRAYPPQPRTQDPTHRAPRGTAAFKSAFFHAPRGKLTQVNRGGVAFVRILKRLLCDCQAACSFKRDLEAAMRNFKGVNRRLESAFCSAEPRSDLFVDTLLREVRGASSELHKAVDAYLKHCSAASAIPGRKQNPDHRTFDTLTTRRNSSRFP